ncbi:MAG: ATP-dependent DNA helicase [Clostridiales bacterium]|nr:ATP-dependent DNA helicase [Clostridiales bacterium]
MRGGSIDTGYMSANRALQGAELHRKIQKQRKKEAEKNRLTYESEVFLRFNFEYEELDYIIEGRADGILSCEDSPASLITIEEIKSTLLPPEQIKNDPERWHWAQAKCYAYIKCITDDLPAAKIRLTYGNLETLETVAFEIEMNVSDLKNFFFALITQYHVFAIMDINRINERDVTAKSMEFPYTFRPGQRELSVAVWKTIKQGKKLFAQAPTGIGKTISVLFPSIKSLGVHAEKIFYCTAKTITRKNAEETLRIMSECGLKVRSVTLTAKEKICPLERTLCNPIDCPRANGHFDRVNSAIVDLVSNECLINRRTLDRYADHYNVCPFEYQLDVSLFCDIIICDYNHVYDPKAKLKRFFTDGGKFILLNDEAHNMVDRGREMFSAALEKCEFTNVKKLFGKKSDLKKLINNIIKTFSLYKDGGDEFHSYSSPKQPDALYKALNSFLPAANEYLGSEMSHAEDTFVSLYFKCLDFLRISELFDSRYIIFCEGNKNSARRVKLFCLDPSKLFADEMKKSKCAVLFSATLTPAQYFVKTLGGDDNSYIIRLPSPFPTKNFCLMAELKITTTYRYRATSLNKVAELILSFISMRLGNYFIFFPSYKYMNDVLTEFQTLCPMVRVLVQNPDMTEQDKEAFLENFSANPKETLTVFAVLGGMFSEGIDLKGDRLIGAVIVGVGMPMITKERDVIADYYEKQYPTMGFRYAYVFPGMNKVMQAAGRIIRSETDKGAALLIDRRYGSDEYRSLFPA